MNTVKAIVLCHLELKLKMIKLFDNKDVLTGVTAEQAVVGTKGFFGDTRQELIDAVLQRDVRTLSYIDKFDAYCFENEYEQRYTLFLPLDKLPLDNFREPAYRPLRTFDEVFNFLIPDCDEDDTDRKADWLLCRIFQLKHKLTGDIYYKTFNRICLSDNDIKLDECDLDHFFENYEIKRNGKFVPFGIKEEND